MEHVIEELLILANTMSGADRDYHEALSINVGVREAEEAANNADQQFEKRLRQVIEGYEAQLESIGAGGVERLRSDDRAQSAQADHLPDSGNMIGAQAVAEPHPPTRHCMCADCLPSFDDTEALPTPKAEPAPIPKYQTPHDFKNFHRQLCARFGYVHDEQFWWRDLVSLIEHIASKAQPAVEPVATGKWFTVVYKNVVPGDEAALIGSHPKASALSWSHAMDDRDEALAKLAAAPNALDASDTALLDCLDQQGYAYGFQDMHEGNHWEIRGAYRTVRDALRAELAAQSAQGGV